MMTVAHSYTFDEEIGAWYFGGKSQAQACATEDLGSCQVRIDWDHFGNIVGVEVMENRWPKGRGSSS